MSISTNTKSQQSNIFNPSDYIDDDYISRSEADIRFLNQNVAYEKMFGSLDITGDSTMTNQLVTGNSVINGNLTSNTINSGVALAQNKSSTIKGNVILGDTGWGTQVSLNGQVACGSNTQKVVIGGAPLDINVSTTPGSISGNIIIGNGSNSTTVNSGFSVNSGNNNISMTGSTIGLNSSGTSVSTCNIGKEDNNTTNLNGIVNIGSSTKTTTINASNLNLNTSGTSGSTVIGNSNLNTTTQVNGTFYVGNGSKQIAMSGSNLSLQNNAGSGSTTLGMAGQASGQTNVFLSSQNLLYNPKLCDSSGVVIPFQNFNLNNPSHFIYNQNLIRGNDGVYTFPQTSTVKQLIFYLYTPSLTNTLACTLTFEFYYYIIQGKLNFTLGMIPSVSLPAQNKVIQACFTTLITKGQGDGGNNFENFILTNTSNPFTSFSNSGTTGLPGMTASTTCTPLGISKASTGSDGRFKITISFPTMTQNSPSSTTQFVMSYGASLRITNSNALGSDPQVYPNNSAHSTAGNAYFSLS